MTSIQTQRLIKQGITVWARNGSLLARKGKGNFPIGIIPVVMRDEIFPVNLQQSLPDALGPEVPTPHEPPHFCGFLFLEFFSAFRGLLGWWYYPASHLFLGPIFCPSQPPCPLSTSLFAVIR